MKAIYIEYINEIRRNLGYDEVRSIDDAQEMLGDPYKYFQELVVKLSEEVRNLKKQVKELENED